jgi:hypothetical protein
VLGSVLELKGFDLHLPVAVTTLHLDVPLSFLAVAICACTPALSCGFDEMVGVRLLIVGDRGGERAFAKIGKISCFPLGSNRIRSRGKNLL